MPPVSRGGRWIYQHGFNNKTLNARGLTCELQKTQKHRDLSTKLPTYSSWPAGRQGRGLPRGWRTDGLLSSCVRRRHRPGSSSGLPTAARLRAYATCPSTGRSGRWTQNWQVNITTWILKAPNARVLTCELQYTQGYRGPFKKLRTQTSWPAGRHGRGRAHANCQAAAHPQGPSGPKTPGLPIAIVYAKDDHVKPGRMCGPEWARLPETFWQKVFRKKPWQQARSIDGGFGPD